MENNNGLSRKKVIGLDSTMSRRNREERVVQIRKDKRFDRAAMQRVKIMEENESLAPKPKNIRPRKILDLLPAKRELLYRDDFASQLEAATYFRKVLSVDKYPPIDLVLESGVLPRLIELLGHKEKPKVQFESTWAITNIACGEPRHTQLLVSQGAVPYLLDIISAGSDVCREQALWALGNISGDSCDSRELLLSLGILEPLLWQLGINSPPHLTVESPSLTTMRHVAWTCSNLTKGQPPLPAHFMQPIMYALTELLQSPDEELIKDVCLALTTVFTLSSVNIQLGLEQGILSRVAELCDTTGASSTVTSRVAVRTLCAVGLSTEPIHRRTLLLTKYKALSSMVKELKLAKDDSVTKDVLHTLACTLDFDARYLEELLSLDLLVQIGVVLQNSNFVLSVVAGSCLCSVIEHSSDEILAKIGSVVLKLLMEVLNTTEMGLLEQALFSINRVLCVAVLNPSDDPLEQLEDRIVLLSSHPSEEISAAAQDIENILGGKTFMKLRVDGTI